MARERNNLYAITADAVDLALDTAGAITSMVGGLANAVGIGGSEGEKSKEETREQIDKTADRITTSVRQTAAAVKPRASRSTKRNASKSAPRKASDSKASGVKAKTRAKSASKAQSGKRTASASAHRRATR